MGNIFILITIAIIVYMIAKSVKTSSMSRKHEPITATAKMLKRSDLGLFVALVAKVAKADGKVDELEAQLVGLLFDDICKTFTNPKEAKEILKEIFNTHKQTQDDIEQIATTLRLLTRAQRAKQQQFMGFLIQLAFVDGTVSQDEERVLKRIAESLKIEPKIYHGIYDQFEKLVKNSQPQLSLDDACAILGVSIDDDLSTIKKAYRKLVRDYHPDIIKAQGADDDYIEKATAKTQQINQAYELVKRDKRS